MPQDPLAEKVANALSRAQTLTFTVVSAALLIGYLATSSLAERRTQYDQLHNELISLSNIANRSDNALREIRRYILLRSTETGEGTAIRHIITLITYARIDADTITSGLIGVIPFEQYHHINNMLTALRTTANAQISAEVDFSPESVVVFKRLEIFHLRDIVVLTHIVAVDPIKLAATLRHFAEFSRQKTPSLNANQLEHELALIYTKDEGQLLAQMADKGNELRDAAEKYGNIHGNLAIGGLSSSYEETLQRVRTLEEQERALLSSLRGNFSISTPWIDQAIPIRLVVGLFPIGLFVGFGMIAVSLDYANRQLGTTNKEAANAGFIFDQLKIPWPSWFLPQLSLVLSLFLPLGAACITIFEYASTLGTGMAVVIWLLVVLAALTAICVYVLAWKISAVAAS